MNNSKGLKLFRLYLGTLYDSRGCLVESQGLDTVILVGHFQLRYSLILLSMTLSLLSLLFFSLSIWHEAKAAKYKTTYRPDLSLID